MITFYTLNMVAEPFVIFSNSHLVTLLIIISIAIVFPLIIKNYSDDYKKRVAIVIGISALALELIKPFIWHYSMDFPWSQLIPIHMCNLSTLFVGLFLLTEKRLLFEVSFFWGIGGGINALLTPDVPRDFPDPQYILFFFGHGLLIVAIAYACITLKNRPSLNSVKNGIYFSSAVLPVIYVINYFIGPPANYWYLATKPASDSLFNLFPEPPLHIPVLVILGIMFFYLIYLPYWFYDKFKKKDVVLEE